jgi:hypothetical protein
MFELDKRTWRVLEDVETDVIGRLRAGETIVIEGVCVAIPCVWCAVSPMLVDVTLKGDKRPVWRCQACRQMVPLSLDLG